MPALVSRKRRVKATRGRGGAKEATTSKDVMKSAGEDNNPGGETVKWWREEGSANSRTERHSATASSCCFSLKLLERLNPSPPCTSPGREWR